MTQKTEYLPPSQQLDIKVFPVTEVSTGFFSIRVLKLHRVRFDWQEVRLRPRQRYLYVLSCWIEGRLDVAAVTERTKLSPHLNRNVTQNGYLWRASKTYFFFISIVCFYFLSIICFYPISYTLHLKDMACETSPMLVFTKIRIELSGNYCVVHLSINKVQYSKNRHLLVTNLNLI